MTPPPRSFDEAIHTEPIPLPAPYLSSRHRELLNKSGLTSAIITARGYRSASKQELTSAGFSPWQAKQIPALLIPIYDVCGNLRQHQMRPDIAPIIDGKPLKYMTPKDSQLCLDVPRAVQPMLRDPSIPLWITEGSRKVDAGAEKGLCIIGALGVTGWMRDGQPLPDWEHIVLQGRAVYVAFDADARTKKPVWQAMQTLKSFLEGRGATVYIIYLPDDENAPDKKIGLDDYLYRHTTDDLLALASETLCPCPSAAGTPPRNELEKLRLSALTEKLRGIADVNPQGGLLISKEATLDELTKATRAVCYLYGRIDDLKKWDLVDLWQALKPHVPYGDNGAAKFRLFGRFAAQLSNWTTKVGVFAADPALRRPHLPFWLHEYVRDLTPDQQQTVFDTFEAAGRLSQSDVQRLIDNMVGVKEAARREPPPGLPGADSSLRQGHWHRLAQIFPESAAEELIRLVHERGAARSEQVLRSAIATELSSVDEPDIWDGYDVADLPPDFTGSEDSDYNFILPPVTGTSEIKNSRQTSRRVFTTVKSGDDENAVLPSAIGPDPDASVSTFHAVSVGEGESSSPVRVMNENVASDSNFTDLLTAAERDELPTGVVVLDRESMSSVANMKTFVRMVHKRYIQAQDAGLMDLANKEAADLILCQEAWQGLCLRTENSDSSDSSDSEISISFVQPREGIIAKTQSLESLSDAVVNDRGIILVCCE